MGLVSCTITPKGTADEQKLLEEAGTRYEPPFAERAIPDLPQQPQWQDVLRRAFLANGELEAAYFQWKAAMQRVQVAGTWPNTDVELGYEYMFSGDRLKSFDRMTFSAGFDPSVNLVWPGKTKQAAQTALSEARAVGEKFRVAKFDLQRKVLNAWTDYVLLGQKIRLLEQDVTLRRIMLNSATAQVQSGRMQRDLLESTVALQMAESELLDMQADQLQARAMLNSLMGREPKAPLESPLTHPPPREVPDDDTLMLVAAADIFPEVAEFAREVEARQDALELAQMKWIPDFNLAAGFTGSVEQFAGFAIVLPTTIPAIRGQIEEARAVLRASEALLRQSQSDRIGEYVGLLVMLRSAQRREKFFQETVLPLTERLSQSNRLAYESNAGELSEWIDSRRMLLDIQLTVAQAEAVIDKAIVEIECCLGTDLEMFDATTQPASQPIERTSHVVADRRKDGHHE
jgi:outer membrane protein TolC